MLLIKISFIVYYQIRFSSDFPVTNFFDNDGSNTIYVMTRTNLWNSNGWFAYGPVYYRLVYILNLIPSIFTMGNASLRQECLYFFAVFISFVSCLWSFFLVLKSRLKEMHPLLVINLALVMFLLLIHSSAGAFLEYIMRPHPDYLQAFFIVLSTCFAVLYLESNNKKFFFISSLFAGVSMSVKLSSVYFCVAWCLSLIFVVGISKNSLKQMLKGILFAVLVYFLVGFPQNFRVIKTLSFLQNQTRFHVAADSTSIMHWLRLLFGNVYVFIPLILALEVKKTESKRGFKFIVILFLVYFLPFILTVNMVIGADHYIFPIFFLLLLLLLHLKERFFGFHSKLIVLAFTLFTLFRPYTSFFTDMIAAKDLCRDDINNTLSFVNEVAEKYDETIIDAYAPYPLPTDFHRSWGLGLDDFKKPRTLFAISWRFADIFFVPPDGFFQQTNPDWVKHAKFYSPLKNHELSSQENLHFKRLRTSNCGLEVWEAIK